MKNALAGSLHACQALGVNVLLRRTALLLQRGIARPGQFEDHLQSLYDSGWQKEEQVPTPPAPATPPRL